MRNKIPEISKKNRSVKAFEDAFLNLLSSTDCSEISISSIVSLSDYSRTAFYTNFEDKTDFINKMVEREITCFIHAIYDSVRDYHSNLFKGDIYIPAEILFEHVYERRAFYHMLIHEKIDGWTVTAFTKRCCALFFGNFSLSHNYEDSLNYDLYHYIETARYLSYIVYWDDNDFCFSPEYMAAQVGFSYKLTPYNSILNLTVS